MAPLLGRTFTDEDDRNRAQPVTVLSYRGWQRHCDGNPDALGQTLLLNGQGYTVVGVLPRAFQGVVPRHTDLYVTMATHAQLNPDMPLDRAHIWPIQIMARIDDSRDKQQVQAALDGLFANRTKTHMKNPDDRPPQILFEDGRRGLAAARDERTKPMLVLLAIVLIVLVVACINLAGLLLARGAARQHEWAVRSAMGANRWHLMRQSLTESLVLVALGAGLGMMLATWGKVALAHLFLPDNMPLDSSNDPRVFGFTLGVSTLAVILFGLMPAWRAMRTKPMSCLKDRSALGSPHLGLGRVLVAAQVGLCLLLLIGAGLFTRTLIKLHHIETGFNTENLLTFKVNARQAGYQDQRLIDFYEQLRTKLQAMPGVQDAANANIQFLSGWSSATTIDLPDKPDRHGILILQTSESFLSTLGIPLLAGRDFSAMDQTDSDPVVLINQSLAQAAFGHGNALGQSLNIRGKDYRVVGVCGDTKYADLKIPIQSIAFFPYRQHVKSTAGITYQVHTVTDPLSLAPAVRRVLSELDPMMPMDEVKTQALQLKASIAQERLFATLGSTLAGLAVLLACIGLYGLLAFNVTRRTSEVGIRMALGATSLKVASPILREALFLSGVGIAIGLPVALLLVRVTESLIYGIEPRDPVTLVVATCGLLGVAMTAAWLPARRAAKIDPMEALRYE